MSILSEPDHEPENLGIPTAGQPALDAAGAKPSKPQVEILRHALGLQRGTREYRNYFITGPGSTDYPYCEELVSAGLMERHDPSVLTGGDPMFTVTEEGKEFARHKPKKRALSRLFMFRVSEDMHAKIKALGGSKWLRKVVADVETKS
jgi:hypothetical protein